MKKNNIKGFTMVELLIVIAIFSVVMASAYTVFDSQQKSYIVQEEVAGMQQNLRAAMFVLLKEVRMAGCYIASQGIQWSADGNTFDFINGIDSFNNYNGEGSDIIDIVYANFKTNTPLMAKKPGDQDAGKYMPNPSSELDVGMFSMPTDNNETCPEFICKDNLYCTDYDDCGVCDADCKLCEAQECFKENDFVIVTNGVNTNLVYLTAVQSVLSNFSIILQKILAGPIKTGILILITEQVHSYLKSNIFHFVFKKMPAESLHLHCVKMLYRAAILTHGITQKDILLKI